MTAKEAVHRYGNLPATLLRVRKGREIYTGVVVDGRRPEEHLYCGHQHRFEDMAMTCARRLGQRSGYR